MLPARPASFTRRLTHVLLWLALMLPLALAAVPARGEGQAPQDSSFLYLPVVQQFTGRIWGLVTEHGAPASGVSVDLWRWDGATWSNSPYAATLSSATGEYSFDGVPALAAGQKYKVEYYNTSDSARLYVWDTQALTSYAAGSSVHIGDFDIANINLVDPAPSATVGLPYTFQWEMRAGVAGDNYEFNLFEYANGDPWFYTDPPLGGVGSYTLARLPNGFAVNIPYVWSMWVYGPGGYGLDAASGEAYWAYDVTFSSSGAALVERVPAAKLRPLLNRPGVDRPGLAAGG